MVNMLSFTYTVRNQFVGTVVDNSAMPESIDPPLRPRSETEWGAFVDSYGRVILEWFSQSNLPRAKVQLAVSKLLTNLHGEFTTITKEADLMFRKWLLFAAHTAWCRLIESRVEAGAEALAQSHLGMLLSIEAHDDFLRALGAECDRQRRGEALRRVFPNAASEDWKAFEKVVLLNKSVADAAQETQCRPTAVSAALYRVRTRLQAELTWMEETI
jgi:hypothetical protein